MGAAVICLVALLAGGAAGVAAAGPCAGGDLYIAAHEDDTLLFQSPVLLEDIQAGHCVQTVFLTAGDSGRPASYWEGREIGAEVAYAQMAGVSSNWKIEQQAINGHPVRFATLEGKPISIAFLRLPDGNINGEGFPAYGEQSLEKLWKGAHSESPAIATIAAVDGSTNYTYEGLIATLGTLIESFQAQEIATQNYTVAFNGPDHPDHVGTGKFVQAAEAGFGAAHLLVAFEDYEIGGKPENVSGEPLAAKSNAFYAYGAHDDEACKSEPFCAGTEYAKWLRRQYVAATESTPGALAGPGQTVLPEGAVKLDGSASFDPGGAPLQYAWTQTAGPKVTLTGATTTTPSFTAPVNPADLAFSLIVANGVRESLPASVAVAVRRPPPPQLPASNPPTPTPPTPVTPSKPVTVKLSKRKLALVVGRASRRLVRVTAPAASLVLCRGRLPKGARCRVTRRRDVVVESSKSVKRAGVFHLTIRASGATGSARQSLTVVFNPSRRRLRG